MDKSYNENIRPFLDLADKLQTILKGTKIKIPRIASCGMQSHGKSSTLESITHISLPKGDGTVTVCPIKISLRRAKTEEEYAKIKFEEESEEKFKKISFDEISENIIKYQNKVKEKNNVKEGEIKLFDEVIQVEVNRKDAPNLTLIDLPGLNFSENLKQQSEIINEKFLKEDETTVLLVMSGSEEITNSYAIEWMKKIPNYQKKFNPIITKADFLKEKNLGVYLDQINSLGLKNRPSLIINKSGSNKNLSFEEMTEKEMEILNDIPDIDNYPNIYKDVEQLINHLIEIQKEDLENAFSDIVFKINKEILNNENILNYLPGECKNQKDGFLMLEECVRNFSKLLKDKKDTLECIKGIPKENLMKYHLHLKFKEHIEKTKIKMSDLLCEDFCNEITHNIIQSSSDNISILEDNVAFNTLIKSKIKILFSEFEQTISDIFDYMNKQIYPLIEYSFGYYKKLAIKVVKLFNDYAKEQKSKVQNFYKEIYYLETENVLTYNNDLLNKCNNLNKHINHFLLGKKLKRSKEMFEEEEEINNVEEKIMNNEEKEKNNKNKKLNFLLNFAEDVINNDYGQVVKDIFQETSKNINSLIGIISNYENENKSRYIENNEFTGRIKIAYRPQDISPHDEKIKNSDYDKFYDENIYEFIPGIQYINKEKLNNFKQLLKNGKVNIKTANTITKMISYLEVMLNRVLDMIFLTIKKYLYDKLTDEDMVNHIKNEIHLLDFKEFKILMEISPEITSKRLECQNNLKKFKQAKLMISKLTRNKYNNIDIEITDENKTFKNDMENNISNC